MLSKKDCLNEASQPDEVHCILDDVTPSLLDDIRALSEYTESKSKKRKRSEISGNIHEKVGGTKRLMTISSISERSNDDEEIIFERHHTDPAPKNTEVLIEETKEKSPLLEQQPSTTHGNLPVTRENNNILFEEILKKLPRAAPGVGTDAYDAERF